MKDIEEQLFEALIDDPETNGGLTDDQKRAEPRNFLRHIAALSGSKLDDGLVDAKLVLSWLLTHLGAGTGFIGLLVPIREAGSLLPQLFTAGAIGALPRRKWPPRCGAGSGRIGHRGCGADITRGCGGVGNRRLAGGAGAGEVGLFGII
jgi:hypothetical protein